MTRSGIHKAAVAAFGLATVLSASAGHADPRETALSCLDIAQLKVLYLNCERRAQSVGMNRAESTGCSEIYYELKARAFGDDYARIRDWYDLMMTLGPDADPTEVQNGRQNARSCG